MFEDFITAPHKHTGQENTNLNKRIAVENTNLEAWLMNELGRIITEGNKRNKNSYLQDETRNRFNEFCRKGAKKKILN